MRRKAFGKRTKKLSKAQLAALDAGRPKSSSACAKENYPPCQKPKGHPAPPSPLWQSPWKNPLKAQKCIGILQQKLFQSTSKADNLRRTSQRRKNTIAGLKVENKRIKTEKQENEKQYLQEIKQLQKAKEDAQHRLDSLCAQANTMAQKNKETKKAVKALKMQTKRLRHSLQRYKTSAKNNLPQTSRLRHKRKYTQEARNLARTLVHAGCAPAKVGKVIQAVARTFGVVIPHSHLMSARTVQRCGLEGLVAADMQLGYELAVTKSCTLSQDSTSHRHINFESHHIAMTVPDYSKGETTPNETNPPVPKIRLVRIASTINHSSENSVKSWLSQLKGISDTYNNCPLAKRMKKPLTLRSFALKLKGMCGDHANGEKSTANMIEMWKHEETIKYLGEQGLLEKDLVDLLGYLHNKKAAKIAMVGGIDLWEEMSKEERGKHEADLMEEILQEVGMDVYNTLNDTERREFDSFIWAGCCMHKFQNSFKGGNATMVAFWERENLPGPIPLANKFNAETIRNLIDPAQKGKPMTDAEKTALENTTRGGVKAMSLAGTLFNNKDDKKGYGDSYQIHRDHAVDGPTSRFPDTSNVRMNSHGDAAGEVLAWIDWYRTFLNDVRNRKKKPGWTNIEKNLSNALNDDPTLTELAVMVLYTETITYPYIRAVRGPGTEQLNVLDLGPLHERVKAHCRAIIDKPSLIIGPDAIANPKTASLDGKAWKNPRAIASIDRLRLEGHLPHLEKVVVAFVEGALETWVRFSEEFAPGGRIDEATKEERRNAWMPSTNDTNEGALGAYRVYMRNKPSTSLHQYNAHAVWERNDVEGFMKVMLDEEDELYIMRRAREIDESGLERERKEEHRAFEQELADNKQANEAAKQKKRTETMTNLSNVVILTSTTIPPFDDITIKEIDAQLNALLKVYLDTEVPKITKRGNKPEKYEYLKAAITRFEKRKESSKMATQTSEATVPTKKAGEEDDELEEEMEPDEIENLISGMEKLAKGLF